MVQQSLEIRLFNESAPEHTVPFATLSRVLEQMQQVIYLLALQYEGREVRERARIPGDVERRYEMRASIPREGSYAVPATIGDPTSDLFAPDATAAIAQDFQEFSDALIERDDSRLRRIVPDTLLRRRLFERYRAMMPRAGSGWKLGVTTGGRNEFVLAEPVRRYVSDSLQRRDADAVLHTVTGRLKEIDFMKRTLTLIYPPTNRELECHYEEGIEDLLLENRRELIHVTGDVILDDDDNPRYINAVKDITDVDLSPLVMMTFEYATYRLRFRQPFELIPTLDETQQLMCLVDAALGIDVFASTREELVTLLQEELDVLWRNYAREDDDNALTPGAQRLKAALAEAIEEVPNAA
jgi:hypothetical protein